MYHTLADAIDALSSTDRGFHFTSSNATPLLLDYRQLRERVLGLARSLAAVGGKRGEPVILILSDQSEFVQGFLAVVRAGMVAVPVHPPPLAGNIVEYIMRVERVRQITHAPLILTSDTLADSLGPSLPDATLVRFSALNNETGHDDLPRVSSDDLALVQFTSGSTGAPKGVALTHRNLIANALACAKGLKLDPARDRGVSWLPMHHDMGLIGFLITPVLFQASNWYLPPLEFARRPHRWLDLLSETRATISYAPNFGYDLVTRRIKSGDTTNWDLTGWRVAGCGGEAILPRVLDSFARRLSPAGFNSKAFVPSYGLAEATLAVAMSPLGRGLMTRSIAEQDQAPGPLVSSGLPVADTEVRIVSTNGNPMPDGTEGEIQVRGPSVATVFWSDDGVCDACDPDGWLKTGDLGLLSHGELHISGRIKEVVALNGRNYYPHDIEECVRSLNEVKAGSTVAFGRPGAGSEQLVLVVESRPSDDAAGLRRRVRTRVREHMGLSVADVVVVDRRTISRTTSGKLQRRAMRTRYLSGELQDQSG